MWCTLFLVLCSIGRRDCAVMQGRGVLSVFSQFRRVFGRFCEFSGIAFLMSLRHFAFVHIVDVILHTLSWSLHRFLFDFAALPSVAILRPPAFSRE